MRISADSSCRKLKSSCIISRKWRQDWPCLWWIRPFVVVRRLLVSCGGRSAVQSGSLTSVFNANDRYAHANILFSPYPSIRNSATSSKRQQTKWPYVGADGMRLHSEDVGKLGTAWIRYEKENKVTCDGCFVCIVPETLCLRDECDWSAAESLLPFEYGPSSEETAEVLLELWSAVMVSRETLLLQKGKWTKPSITRHGSSTFFNVLNWTYVMWQLWEGTGT